MEAAQPDPVDVWDPTNLPGLGRHPLTLEHQGCRRRISPTHVDIWAPAGPSPDIAGTCRQRVGSWTWPPPSRGRAPMPIPTGTLQSNGFSGSRRRPEGRSSSSFHRKMPSQARGLSAPTRGSVEGWRAGLGRTGLLPLASPATSFRKSRSLISITRSAGREKKKQHARAERLRDHKIEDRLFLGLMIGGSTGLASLSLFFRIKSTSKALAVGCG